MTISRSATIVAAAGIIAMLAPLAVSAVKAQEGHASWYALRSRTASGEMMNPNAMTAAHRTLPFGTRVRVENLRNGRSVVVRINDRGPFVRGRVIDLSRAAASQLGFLKAGTTRVRITTLGGGSSRPSVASAPSSSRSRTAQAEPQRGSDADGTQVIWVNGRPEFGG